MNHLTLVIMLLIPIFGALIIFASPKQAAATAAGPLALGVSVLTGLVGITLLARFNYAAGGVWQFAIRTAWIPQFGVHFSLGVDGIGLWLVMLTLLITPAAILDSFDKVHSRHSEFYGWMLLLFASTIGVFIAHDVLLFYLFFEFTLIPSFFLIGIWGHSERRRAAGKFFLYAFTGSVFLLVSLLYLAWVHAERFHTYSFTLAGLY